jgi:ABC-type nitrate/sulfonate/bicarbonate transport system substrate-binding protein
MPIMNRRKRFRKLGILGAGLSLILLNLTSSHAQLTRLNVVYTGSGGQSDVVKFTYSEGVFRKHGLDASMVYVVSGVTTAQAVASGTAPIANTTAVDALRAISAGAPIKIIMVSVDRFQHLFVARPGINSPKDMKGKSIAISRYGDFSHVQTRFLVRQWGMDPERDVQLLQIGNSGARAAALFAGRVDGALVSPAFVPMAKKAGVNVIFDLSTIPTKFANQIVIANDGFMRERPALAKAAVVSLLDGIKLWLNAPEAARQYLKKTYNASDSDIESIYSESKRFIRPRPTPDPEGIQNAWESLTEIKDRGPFEMSRFVEPRLIEEALKESK